MLVTKLLTILGSYWFPWVLPRSKHARCADGTTFEIELKAFQDHGTLAEYPCHCGPSVRTNHRQRSTPLRLKNNCVQYLALCKLSLDSMIIPGYKFGPHTSSHPSHCQPHGHLLHPSLGRRSLQCDIDHSSKRLEPPRGVPI